MLIFLASSAIADFVPEDKDGQEIMNEVQQQGLMETDEEPILQEFEDKEPTDVQEMAEDNTDKADTEEYPADTEEYPADTEEYPADTEEYPANKEENDDGATKQEESESQGK